MKKEDIRKDRFVSSKDNLKKITSLRELTDNEIKFLKENGLYEKVKIKKTM